MQSKCSAINTLRVLSQYSILRQGSRPTIWGRRKGGVAYAMLDCDLRSAFAITHGLLPSGRRTIRE